MDTSIMDFVDYMSMVNKTVMVVTSKLGSIGFIIQTTIATVNTIGDSISFETSCFSTKVV